MPSRLHRHRKKKSVKLTKRGLLPSSINVIDFDYHCFRSCNPGNIYKIEKPYMSSFLFAFVSSAVTEFAIHKTPLNI